MSMFNDDQIGHMRSLAAMPDEARCWCGWYKAGECPNCRTTETLADRRSSECSSCGSYPHEPGGRLVHRIGCSAHAIAPQGAGGFTYVTADDIRASYGEQVLMEFARWCQNRQCPEIKGTFAAYYVDFVHFMNERPNG